ncbi:MAG: allophanate hydrolase subunit 1 [Planctomycetota bacterium]
MHAPPDTAWTSERTLRLAWPDAGDGFPAHASAWCARIRDELGPDVTDAVAGLRSLVLHTDPLAPDRSRIERRALEIVADARPSGAQPSRDVEIPVCFDGAFAPDLRRCRDDAIDRFTAATYRPALFGFAPGFAYLTGLPSDLHLPRLDTPRPRVASGSVAIAERFAAVYPGPTPGGWNIIGRTPLVMFDHTRPEPALLRVGDSVRFVPITTREYESLRP